MIALEMCEEIRCPYVVGHTHTHTHTVPSGLFDVCNCIFPGFISFLDVMRRNSCSDSKRSSVNGESHSK